MLQHHPLSVTCHSQKKLHVVVTTHVLSQVIIYYSLVPFRKMVDRNSVSVVLFVFLRRWRTLHLGFKRKWVPWHRVRHILID